MLWILLFGIAFALAGLHRRTGGRSSPVAALGFVLGGPLLGVLLLVPAALEERGRENGVPSGDPQNEIYGLEIGDYCLVMITVGLVAALLAAVAYTDAIRDELQDFRENQRAPRPRPVASPALHALGLNAFATLDEIERAYRQKALEMHPDRGGDAARFKRLQQHYELAKRYVRRTRTDAASEV